ncbi:hypothetical protein BDW22DRAFT_1355618 [Trametopsis cervina]|nr:hypothetical protein BDW22DRAFT_1355618 [Trametopsis cervina]
MLGMQHCSNVPRRTRRAEPIPSDSKKMPLLEFGRLHEVSLPSAPIHFGKVAVPTEVFYEIIEKLHQRDKGTLANCARVCKSWYYATRSQLFREVRIRETALTYLFYPFARTLRTMPEVCHLVKELHLSMGMELRWNDQGLHSRPEFNLEVLGNIVMKLPSLEVMSLTGTLWQLEDPSSMPQIIHPGLKSLRIESRAYSAHDSRVHDIVRWFPGLKELYVNRAYATRDEAIVYPPLSVDLELEILEMSTEALGAEYLLKEITATRSIGTIHTFTYQVWKNSYTRLANFLHEAGPNLHDIRLLFDERLLEERMRMANGYDDLNIHRCTALETLGLDLTLVASRGWGSLLRAVHMCIRGVASRLCSNQLHTITLRFDVSSATKEFEGIRLEHIVEHLHNLPRLRRIVIVTRRTSIEVARVDVRRALAPLEDLLEFRTLEEERDGRVSPHNLNYPHVLIALLVWVDEACSVVLNGIDSCESYPALLVSALHV